MVTDRREQQIATRGWALAPLPCGSALGWGRERTGASMTSAMCATCSGLPRSPSALVIFMEQPGLAGIVRSAPVARTLVDEPRLASLNIGRSMASQLPDAQYAGRVAILWSAGC